MIAIFQKKFSFSLILAIIAAGSFFLIQPSRAAATITFHVPITEYGINPDDGGCSLSEVSQAIINDAVTYFDCVGVGASKIATGDTVIVELESGKTYKLGKLGSQKGHFSIGSFLSIMVIVRPDGSGLVTLDATGSDDRVISIGGGENVQLERLVIQGGSTDDGAGIKNSGDFLTITDSIIKNNSSASSAGGIRHDSGKLTIVRTAIENNTAAGNGGGIWVTGGSGVVITDSTIANNTAGTYGGGISAGSGGLTVTGSAIYGNTTTGNGSGSLIFQGGGIYFNDFTGNLTITNTTIASNNAGTQNSFITNRDGGGVYIANVGAALFDAVTIILNHADGNGGGVGTAFLDGSETVTFKNTLISGNTSAGTAKPNCYWNASESAPTSNGNNLEQVTSAGSASSCGLNQSTDILTTVALSNIFNSTIADNGGPTKTHALVPGSPAINKGGTGQTKDQRGALRPQGVASDIGAFEIGEVSIGDATAVAEGNSGTKTMSFSVTLTASQPNAVSVSYTTQAGTAASGSDFQAGSGTLSFAAGETTKTVTVTILGDTEDESDETVSVVLSSLSGIVVNDETGNGTITDDDEPAPAAPAGTISIADATITEGDSGTKLISLLVTLSAPQSSTVRANYATKGVTATAGTDYASKTGTITFLAGETQHRVEISVKGDTTDEPNETFEVNLSALLNITAGDLTGVATILDDDAAPAPPSQSEASQTPPTVSIGDVGLVEGDKGTTKTMTFTVFLSAAQSKTATLEYATSAKDASADVDYTPKSGVITFDPNETKKTVGIVIFGDAIDEKDETFVVTLSKLTNLTAGQMTATGIIIDDDEPAGVAPPPPPPPASSTPTATSTSASPTSGAPSESTGTTPSSSAPAKNVTCTLTLGKPYKHPDHPAVWLITLDDFAPEKTACSRRVFKNPDVYDSYGFERWSDVITVSKAVLESIPKHTIPFIEWGPERLYLHGEIVKTPSDPKVYMLIGTKKHPIDKEQTFLDLDLDFAAILDVTKIVLDSYATGDAITGPFTVPNGALIQYEGSTKVYLLENNLQKHIATESAFTKNNFSWNGILTLPKDFPPFASGAAVK